MAVLPGETSPETQQKEKLRKLLLAEQVADAFSIPVYFESIILTTIIYLGNMHIHLLSSQPRDIITLIQFYLPTPHPR